MELKNIKSGVIVTIILTATLVSVPLIPNLLKSVTISDWLFLTKPTQNTYHFNADKKGYLYAEINNTDKVSITLDNNTYTLSYGGNFIPYDFSNTTSYHTLELLATSLPFIETICAEPIEIYNQKKILNLVNFTEINFNAAGPISILSQPDFYYNNLYVELDGIIIKDIFNQTSIPMIDSAVYAAIVQGGSYIKYDITVNPGSHTLKLLGNGTADLLIQTNMDYDKDKFSDSEELCYDFYGLDPENPDIWGYFENGNHGRPISSINSVYKGYFNFYIPKCSSCTTNQKFLYVDVYNGDFYNFKIDNDELILDGVRLQANYPNTTLSSTYVKPVDGGWHTVEYNYKSYIDTPFTNISFRINTKPIILIDIPEMIDSDGDGLKDSHEISSGLNIQSSDTDSDNIPDNLDQSPNSKIVLNKNKINQITIPVDSNKNSIITIQTKKPNTDYSTGNTPRLWRNSFNVSIIPAIRLLGNNQKTLNQLQSYWGKSIQTYNLVSGYSYSGNGDNLPGVDANQEYTFIFPKPTENNFEYDIKISKDHPSLSDGILDLRFDFVWLVTKYDSASNEHSIIHYYDFTEDILVQSIVKQEVGNINYILASPKNMIQTQAFYAYIQNPNLDPTLNSKISNQIVGIGQCDYYELASKTLSDRQLNPRSQFESEVLFVSGLMGTQDILNSIKLVNNPSSEFIENNLGNCEAFFSYFSISDLYQQYKFGDAEIQGEQKIIYQNYYEDKGDRVEKTSNLIGLPLKIEIKEYTGNDVLEIEQVVGVTPTNQIPQSIDDPLYYKLQLWKETFIEKKEYLVDQIPVLNFDNTKDEHKIHISNRLDENDVFNEFFRSHSVPPVDDLVVYLVEFIEKIRKIRIELNYLKDLTYNMPIETRTLLSEGYDEITELERSLLTFDPSPDSFNDKSDEILKFFKRQRGQPHSSGGKVSFGAQEIADDWGPRGGIGTKQYSQKMHDSADEIVDLEKQLYDDHEALSNKLKEFGDEEYNPLNCNPACDTGVEEGVKNAKLKAQLKGVAIGSVAIVIGILTLIYGITEMYKLISTQDEYQGRQAEYALRMAGAVSMVVLGVLSITIGITVLAGTFGLITAKALESALTVLGKAVSVIAILVVVFEIGTLIARAVSGDLQGSELTFQIIKTAITLGFSVALPLAIAAAVGSTGVGAIAGLVIAGVSLLTGWITTLINNPNMEVVDSRFTIPEENIKKKGSLTVGDTISLELDIENTGDRDVWFRSKFGLGGSNPASSDWTSWKGKWDGDPRASGGPGYEPDDTDTLSFSLSINAPTPNLYYHLKIEIDAEIVEIIVIIPVWHRVEGARSTQSNSMNTPVLDSSIAAFYDDTVPLQSIESQNTANLVDKFYASKENYQYKDAYDAANQLISMVENSAKITVSKYDEINNEKESYNYNYYKYQTNNYGEYSRLIWDFFDDGFRAKNPISFSFLGQKMQHILSAANSDGYILIPIAWFEEKNNDLSDARLYIQRRNELPLRSNLNLDLRNLKISLNKDIAVTKSIPLIVDGPDNFIAEIKLETIIGVTINPERKFQLLKSNIDLTLRNSDPSLLADVYYVEMQILKDGNIIYETEIPFKIEGISDLRVDIQIHPDQYNPIIPGNSFTAFNLDNKGTIPEFIEISTNGISDSFIDTSIAPQDFTGTTQSFMLLPGYYREGLRISIPRHYSILPGEYSYSSLIRDPIVNVEFEQVTQNFYIGEFYDITVDTLIKNQIYYDSEYMVYDVNITNYGNVEQTFNLVEKDLEIAQAVFLENDINLQPGESKLTSFYLIPLINGTDEFELELLTQYNSSSENLFITVIDDDITSPEISISAFNYNTLSWNVNLIENDGVYDSEASATIYLLRENEIISRYFDVSEGISQVTIPLRPGNYTVNIYASNNDLEWNGDEETSFKTITFEYTLLDAYIYVDQKLIQLQDFIDDEVFWLIGWDLENKIQISRYALSESYSLFEYGCTNLALLHDSFSQIMLDITECYVEFWNHLHLISDEDALQIENSLHDIKGNIILLMGSIVGTDTAYNIAIEEVKIEQLSNWVDDQNDMDLNFVEFELNQIKNSLEFIIYELNNNFDIECEIISVQCRIENTIEDINYQFGCGKITQIQNDYLVLNLNNILVELEEIKNNL